SSTAITPILRSSADPDRQVPDDRAGAIGRAPGPRELRFDEGNRVLAPRGGVPARRGPGSEVTEEAGQRPVELHPECRHFELLERELDRAIALFRQDAFGGPVRPHDVAVEAADDDVDLRIRAEQVVAPHGHDAARDEDALDLTPEARAVEPVEGLRDRHEID